MIIYSLIFFDYLQGKIIIIIYMHIQRVGTFFEQGLIKINMFHILTREHYCIVFQCEIKTTLYLIIGILK